MLVIVRAWQPISLKHMLVTIIATMVLSSIFFVGNLSMMIYPLAIGGACILTSIAGTFFVRLDSSNNIMGALYKGFIATAIFSVLILYPVTDRIIGLNNVYTSTNSEFNGFELYLCGVTGLVITGLIIWVTEYYTGTKFRPVLSIAKIFYHGTRYKCNTRISCLFRGYSFTCFDNC